MDAVQKFQTLIALNSMITRAVSSASTLAGSPYKEISNSLLELLAAKGDIPEQDSSRLKKVVALFEACDDLVEAAAQIALEEVELQLKKMTEQK